MGIKSERKKALTLEYKERKVSGGIYKITNALTQMYLLAAAANLQGLKNRFEFSRNTGSCVMPLLQKDWNEYGAKAFIFEILEEIEKKETQTAKEFQDDLKILYDLWSEKFDKEKSY